MKPYPLNCTQAHSRCLQPDTLSCKRRVDFVRVRQISWEEITFKHRCSLAPTESSLKAESKKASPSVVAFILNLHFYYNLTRNQSKAFCAIFQKRTPLNKIISHTLSAVKLIYQPTINL